MRHPSTLRRRLSVAVLLAGGVVAGCASSQPLQTEGSTSGIRAAEELGAAKVPEAKLHLQLAKEELGSAEALAKSGDAERANSMLLRAEADAQLAVALSREDVEKNESLVAVERVRQLRQDHKLPVAEGNQP
jgi:hypothetical protein